MDTSKFQKSQIQNKFVIKENIKASMFGELLCIL